MKCARSFIPHSYAGMDRTPFHSFCFEEQNEQNIANAFCIPTILIPGLWTKKRTLRTASVLALHLPSNKRILSDRIICVDSSSLLQVFANVLFSWIAPCKVIRITLVFRIPTLSIPDSNLEYLELRTYVIQEEVWWLSHSYCHLPSQYSVKSFSDCIDPCLQCFKSRLFPLFVFISFCNTLVILLTGREIEL